jgi:hypothetical protein
MTTKREAPTTVRDMNLVLARFMEWDESATFLFYELDWNPLMLVVEKIESLHENGTEYNVGIEINSCFITKWDYGEKDEKFSLPPQEDAANKIEAVYYAVYDFIIWHNEQKLTPKHS